MCRLTTTGGAIVMICKNCGKEIKDTAKFCGYCGAVNEPISTTPISNDIENTEYKPSWMPEEAKSNTTSNNDGNTGYTPSWMTQGATQQPRTNTVNNATSVDLGTEIKKNGTLFALPCIYLVWQIIRQLFLDRLIFSMDSGMYELWFRVVVLVGCLLFGVAIGGAVIATNYCSKTFKWVYTIPICLIELYWIISSLDYMESAIMCVFEFLEIFVAIGIAIGMHNTSLGKELSTKSMTIISVIAAAGSTLAFRFVYYLLLGLMFGGHYSFSGWMFMVATASIIGSAIAPAILSKTIKNNDSKKA